jgi:hypothetical protein
MNPISVLLRTTILAATVAGALALQSCDDRQFYQQPPAVTNAPGALNPPAYQDTAPIPPLPQPSPPVAPPVKKYPTATKTDNPNLVVSPYKPYNVIDIKGFQPGALAKDPSNNQIFVIP